MVENTSLAMDQILDCIAEEGETFFQDLSQEEAQAWTRLVVQCRSILAVHEGSLSL